MKVFLGETLTPCRVAVSDPLAVVVAAGLTGGAGYLGVKSTPKYPRIGALTGSMAGATVASMALAHVIPQEGTPDDPQADCMDPVTLDDSIRVGMLAPLNLATAIGAFFGPTGVIVGSMIGAAVVAPPFMTGKPWFPHMFGR